MPLLNKETQAKLRDFLARMGSPVNLVFFTQEYECSSCRDTHSFLEELVALSDKLALTVYDFQKDHDQALKYGVDKIPAVLLLDENMRDPGVRFYGMPAGYEINSFVGAVLELSGMRQPLPPELMKRIRGINRHIHIQVFVTLTCPYCPAAVLTAHRLAMESSHITADMVESGTFPYLANKYNVSGVPKTVINETHELVGAQPLDRLLDAIEELQISGPVRR